jgi:steroid delta-isomerase-like uncharacterized protein
MLGNKVLVYRWFEETWNKKNEAVIDELLHPDALLYGLTSMIHEPIRGPLAYKEFWRKIVIAFPDIHISVESTLAEDDKVAVRCGIRATHNGPHLGFPATGKKIDITGISIVTLTNGRISESWSNFDFLGIYKQIGLFKYPNQ